MAEFKYVGTVSHGTLRTSDLIQTLGAVLAELDPTRPVSALLLDEEEQEDHLVELFDSLAELAPAGFWFGAHEGDGSDFGFWPVDTDAW